MKPHVLCVFSLFFQIHCRPLQCAPCPTRLTSVRGLPGALPRLGPLGASAGFTGKEGSELGIYESYPHPQGLSRASCVTFTWSRLLVGDSLSLGSGHRSVPLPLQAQVVTALAISPAVLHCPLWLPYTLPKLRKYPLHLVLLQSCNLSMLF